jgi:hypothetical protein
MGVNRATQNVVRGFGLILSLAGFEHGIGEILQGNTSTNDIFIQSWGDSELFSILSGEPAMTLIPNFLVSGILTIILSCLAAAWCLFFLAKSRSSLVLLLLSVALLLVGGGFGPPLVGIIIGLAGTQLDSDFSWLKSLRSKSLFRTAARIWPFSLALGLACYLYLFPVSIILWGAWDIFIAEMIAIAGILAFLMIFVSILSAYSFDTINAGENV